MTAAQEITPMQDVCRTVSHNFHNNVSLDFLREEILPQVRALEEAMSGATKSWFYGKPPPKIIPEVYTQPSSVDGLVFPTSFETPLSGHPNLPINAYTLHAVMGLANESLELLVKYFSLEDSTSEGSKAVLVDEAGDIHWFLMLLSRSFGYNSLDEFHKANINKLRARFPDKFDSNLAINKSEVAELEVVTRSLGK